MATQLRGATQLKPLSVTNAEIATAAAIAYAKLNLTGAIVNADIVSLAYSKLTGVPAVVAPAGTLTGATLAAGVLASSLTSVGTLTGGATGAGFTVALSTSTITGTLAQARIATEFTTTTTGNIDDLNFSNASTIRMNNASLATIRGLLAGTPGQRVVIVSVGAGQVNLAWQDAGSTAANRLIPFVTQGPTPLAAGFGTATLEYDGTTARWRLVTHDQGALIAFTPVVSFGSASVGVTYTNQTGNFFITGRLIWIDARCALSNKGSSGGGAQIDGMPYSLSALAATCVIDAFNLVGMTGTPYIIPNGLGLVIAQTAATGRGVVSDTNFANNTDVRGGGTFSI